MIVPSMNTCEAPNNATDFKSQKDLKLVFFLACGPSSKETNFKSFEPFELVASLGASVVLMRYMIKFIDLFFFIRHLGEYQHF